LSKKFWATRYRRVVAAIRSSIDRSPPCFDLPKPGSDNFVPAAAATRALRASLSMQSQSLDGIGLLSRVRADRAVLPEDAARAGRTNKRRVIRICTDSKINGTEKPRRLSIAQQEIRALEGVFSWTIFCGNS
jgi:hypothetical protein